MMRKKPSRKFWEGYRGLYGKGEIENKAPTSDDHKVVARVARGGGRKSNVDPYNLTESREQSVFSVWLDKNKILHYAIPNGGSRHLLEAFRMKREGVKAGVPDICIPVARKGFNALYIEMKRKKGGKVSDAQNDWIFRLNREGNLACVAYGADEAMKIVKDYFGME